MGKRKLVYNKEEMLSAEIKLYGFTHDFFGEVLRLPETEERWQSNYRRLQEGEVRTYSQRYANEPTVLAASDPETIRRLDTLVTEAIAAAQSNEEAKAREIWEKIKVFEGKEPIKN